VSKETAVPKLIIVESPTKAKEIGHMLGRDYTVVASVGHVRDLPPSDMGVDLETFEPHYELTERGREVVSKIKKLAAQADQIILATDPDREGESISWHLAQALKLPQSKTLRVTYHEITERAVREALANPRKIDMALVHAQEARRVLDRLIGYRVSPKVCELSRQRLSAGRVQTPTLRLIVEREQTIRAHKTTNHFGAELTLPEFKATWERKPYLKPGEEFIMDRALAQKAADVRDLTVKTSSVAPQSRKAPAPFTTSAMLQAASAKLGMKSDEAMQAAQTLFENKLISYHRTDSVNLSPEAIAMIRDFARSKGLPLPAKPNTFKAKQANAQEAHECIRPTDMTNETPRIGQRVAELYALIHAQALACQLADAKVEQTKLVLESADGRFQFTAQGQRVLERGFTEVLGAIEESFVPALKQGTKIRAQSGRVLEMATKASPRYTDGSLNAELERRGIGRPATWAAILKNLRARGYIVDQGKFIAATPLGEALVDSLRDCAFADYGYTAELEEHLDEVSRGEATYKGVVAAANKEIDVDIQYVAFPEGGWPAPVSTGYAARKSTGPARKTSSAKKSTTTRKTTARKPAAGSKSSTKRAPKRY
jgi:DNA topoisomerase-1